MKGFGSDNHSGVHPELLKAITDANLEHAPSYGTDLWTEKALHEFRRHFGADTEIFFVFNGTAANSLALASLVKSYESVLVTDVSHVQNDECGAPEFFSGAKLIPLPSHEGKFRLADLQESLIRRGDQHSSQVRAISITQPTELGTLYSLEELSQITSWAHQNGLKVHMDGARFSNAVVALKSTFQRMTREAGIDVLSFGGTKNGFLFGEAVLFFDPKLAEGFRFQRKQGGQLPSKSRFLAAQFHHYLQSDLWQKISTHSLAMAQFLEKNVRGIKGVEIDFPVQGNAVFARIPQKWVKPLREKHFFYVWDEKTFSCRWMCSWDTSQDDILSFAAELKKLSARDFA